MILVIIAMAVFTAWWLKQLAYASMFTPTLLTVEEQAVLDSKLARLEATSNIDRLGPTETRRDKSPPLNQKNILKKVQRGDKPYGKATERANRL